MDVSHKEHEATLLESSQDLAGSPRPVAALPFSVPHDPVVNRSGWPRTVVIITAEVMGAGVLGLPFAFARLGWVLGLAACLFFAATAVYAGLLLARVRGSLYPSASSYGEVAQLAVGPRFGAFTRACIYTTWAMYLPYYLLTCTSALRLALGQLGVHGWCTWQIAALVSSLLALPMQMRNLHLIAYLGALSSAATLLAVALVVASLLNRGPTPGVTHELWPDLAAAHDGGVHVADAALRLYGAFGTIIFAYQGQSIFLEIMREMRDARRFGAAVAAANTLMFAVYTFVTVAAYAVDGRHVADFLPSSMPAGPAKSTVSILLAFTSAVSYVITGQPLHRRIHLAISPSRRQPPTRAARSPRSDGPQSRRPPSPARS